MLILKILAGLFLIAGLIMVAGAKKIAKRYGLDRKVILENESGMDEEGLEEYKMLKATVNIKLYGMMVFLPGLILLLIVFNNM